MYKIVELNEYLDENDHSISARVGEDEDDVTLTVGCQEMCVTKKEVRKLQRWLKAILKEAE